MFDISTIAYAEHCNNVENAVRFMVNLMQDDIDPSDPEVFNSVMKRFDLDSDGFSISYDDIMAKVRERSM